MVFFPILCALFILTDSSMTAEECELQNLDNLVYCEDDWGKVYQKCLKKCPRIFGRAQCKLNCENGYEVDVKACARRQCQWQKLDEKCEEALGKDAANELCHAKLTTDDNGSSLDEFPAMEF